MNPGDCWPQGVPPKEISHEVLRRVTRRKYTAEEVRVRLSQSHCCWLLTDTGDSLGQGLFRP